MPRCRSTAHRTAVRSTASRYGAPLSTTIPRTAIRSNAKQHQPTRSNTIETRSNTQQHDRPRIVVVQHDDPCWTTMRTMAPMHPFNSELFLVVSRRNHCRSHVNLLMCGLFVQLRSKSDQWFVRNNKNSDYRHGMTRNYTTIVSLH